MFTGHKNEITTVAFSANGKLLASASEDKTIRLWDTRTHEQFAVTPLGSVVYGVAFSPNGTRLAAGCTDGTRLVSGSGDFTVRVWDSLSPAAHAARYQWTAALRAAGHHFQKSWHSLHADGDEVVVGEHSFAHIVSELCRFLELEGDLCCVD